MQPVIGITTALHTRSDNGRKYHQTYAPNALAIERAGGLPLLIPAGLQPATLRALYERVDALLVPGGGDINPARYDAQPHPLTTGIDDARDSAEITLTRWAIEDDRPLLGICRGHQLVHVALGGALVQDIPSQVDTTIRHDNPVDRPRDLIHPVTVAPGSRLATILGDTRVMVNSLHHQAVTRPASGMVITARAPDGLIEGSEHPDRRFFVAVQWHPEDLVTDDPAMQRLFDALVAAARDHAGA